MIFLSEWIFAAYVPSASNASSEILTDDVWAFMSIDRLIMATRTYSSILSTLLITACILVKNNFWNLISFPRSAYRSLACEYGESEMRLSPPP